MDLYNRQVVGFGASDKKDASLVYASLAKIDFSLCEAKLFHTDRGREFDNKVLDEVLSVFSIERSLSRKGCPYDNAVAEAAYKTIKTEFVCEQTLGSLEQLRAEFFPVHWYNTERLHSSLNYTSPVDFSKNSLFKLS